MVPLLGMPSKTSPNVAWEELTGRIRCCSGLGGYSLLWVVLSFSFCRVMQIGIVVWSEIAVVINCSKKSQIYFMFEVWLWDFLSEFLAPWSQSQNFLCLQMQHHFTFYLFAWEHPERFQTLSSSLKHSHSANGTNLLTTFSE